MRQIKICITGLILLLIGIAADKPPASAPAALPSQKTIVSTFEAKDYAGVLQQIIRVLPLKGEKAVGYDRHVLLILKAESHMQLKQFKSAGDAFAAAAKETDDDTKASEARAMQLLLKQSKGGNIQRRIPRKGEKLQSANVLDQEQRKDAFRIAYEDLRAEAEPKVKAALKSRSLKEISGTIDTLGDVHDLEIAATGSHAQHLAMHRELGERAKSLISKQLEQAQNDVLEIRERANSIVQEKVSFRADAIGESNDRRIIRRGLSEKDRTDLQEAIAACHAMLKTAKSLAKSTDATPAEIDELTDRARETVRIGERVLGAKY
jgi:hypothetical protein